MPQTGPKAVGRSSAPRFLSGRGVWTELQRRSARAKNRIHAAVAYFGKDGANLLTLKAGDTLLVDMSLRAVRQGVTDPREIKKLMKKKVQVFSRGGLHAKFYLIDNALVCGSANVSVRSSQVLDEAAVLTCDKTAVRIARAYLRKMCSEPVTEPYLKKCLKEYRPPWFVAARGGQPQAMNKSKISKVWFLGGLKEIDIAVADEPKVEKIEKDVGAALDGKHEVTFVRYRNRPSWFGSIRQGNWVVCCMRSASGRRHIDSPCQVLRKRKYRSSRGVVYHLLMLSHPIDGDETSLTRFQPLVRRIVPALAAKNPRTQAIAEPDAADALLRLWTPNGKFRKRHHA